MRLAIVLVISAVVAWFTYWQLERLGPRAWVPALARTAALCALGLLLLDLTCAVAPSRVERPLILLDGSLSMTASGGRWPEALDSAQRWGEVRLFGDDRPGRDTVPTFGRSDVVPALAAAAASDRQVIVVSDGEITDASDIPAEALSRVGVRLFPRQGVPDLAITRITGPDRVTAGDTIRLEAEVRAFGALADSVWVEVRVDQRVLLRRAVRLGTNGSALVPLVVGSRGLSGDVLFRVAVPGAGDAERRDDARLWLVQVTPTPGIVLLASPGDWDGRFLFQTLRAVGQLPLRGYTRFEAGRWRSMETLAPVAAEEVAHAARLADVLVVKGAAPELVRGSRARGIWYWPSGEGGETEIPGEWYPIAAAASPVAGAFLAQPVDSFPPLIQITPIQPDAGEWVGLMAQLSRRGAERPILTGRELEGRRRVMTAADGLWRWAFRGGSSEQSYRGLVSGTLSYLLGGADPHAARARPLRSVVPNGRPVVFEWVASGNPAPIGVGLSGAGGTRRDTLRFDGNRRAQLWLSPGQYRYELESGGGGLVAVDEWSEEWLPHPAQLASRAAPGVSLAGVTSTRQWVWLFGLMILALSAEWLARRRLGLR
jgi:hypothetical protein